MGFAPKGRAERPEGPAPSSSEPPPSETDARRVSWPSGLGWVPLLHRMALPPGSCDSVLGLCVWCGWGMIVKLPFWACLVAGWLVRPIFENSTACTCHMPNNLGHFFVV